MDGKEFSHSKIGVLALQGAVREHRTILTQLGAEVVEVKKAEQLEDIDGLVVPGGESTVISRLLHIFDLFQPLQRKIAQGLPVMGTCAGLILMANQIEGQAAGHLRVLDVQVKRNAFGRQVESFEQQVSVVGMDHPFPAVFIRAPLIQSVGSEVKVLATIDQQIVAVQQGHLLGLSFHPELTRDNRFHQLFLDLVRHARKTTI